MRCLFTDGRAIHRGFKFTGTTGLTIGNQRIEFDDSLIYSPIGHFGDHIVNCGVSKEDDPAGGGKKLKLVSAAHNQWCGDNSTILLHIRQSVNNGAKIATSTTGNVTKHLEGLDQDFSGNAEVFWVSNYWDALVELTWGSSLIVEEQFEEADSRSFGEILRRVKPIKRQVTIRTIYSSDGRRLSISSERT